MSTPQQRLEADVKAAMKSGDKERLSVLRMLLTEVQNAALRGGEVDEAGFLALVRKSIKQREEATVQFRKGNRPELADQEEREAALLAEFLPAQVGEADIRAAITEILAQHQLASPAAMGALMKELKARFGATADGATLSRLAREALAG